MRYYTVILCLFLSSYSIAQLDVTAGTVIGFETNINQVPDRLELNEDLFEKEDLYMNSAYQDLIVQFKYNYSWGKNSLTFYLTPDIRYYFSETESSQTILNTRISHKYMIKKNFYIFLELSVISKMTSYNFLISPSSTCNLPSSFHYLYVLTS